MPRYPARSGIVEVVLLSRIDRKNLDLVDALEATFNACEHPYATEPDDSWCNACGAQRLRLTGAWLKPHWRDVLVKHFLGSK